jgi:hypothetical protein
LRQQIEVAEGRTITLAARSAPFFAIRAAAEDAGVLHQEANIVANDIETLLQLVVDDMHRLGPSECATLRKRIDAGLVWLRLSRSPTGLAPPH